MFFKHFFKKLTIVSRLSRKNLYSMLKPTQWIVPNPYERKIEELVAQIKILESDNEIHKKNLNEIKSKREILCSENKALQDITHNLEKENSQFLSQIREKTSPEMEEEMMEEENARISKQQEELGKDGLNLKLLQEAMKKNEN